MAEAHERKAKRILARDWAEICGRWLDHSPNISTSGSAPTLLLHELPDLEARLTKIPDSQVEECVESIPGLRPGLLHEGIYLLHKAAHVLGASLVHVSQGMCTWSLSSGYQAAFFSVKAAMAMLGVSIVECKGRHFLVDVWGRPQKPRKGIKGPIVLLANTPRNEQRHIWGYFQRVLQQTEGIRPLIGEELWTVIVKSEITAFARQRNALHYRTNGWAMDDLHECRLHQDFGEARAESLAAEHADYSVLLALGLVRVSRNMLAAIAGPSAVLRSELVLIDAWLNLPFNKLYKDSAPGCSKG